MSLDDYGLNAKLLVAGFSGGAVHAFVFKQNEPWAIVSSVATGAVTANFWAPAASHYIGSWLGDGGSAFAVGLCAMALCQGAVAAVRKTIARRTEAVDAIAENRK